MRARDWLVLGTLSLLWGGSFPLMRVAAPELGAFLLISLRVLIAALFLVAYNATRGALIPPGKAWPALLVVGVGNAALPFVLFAEALRHVPTTLAAPLNATTPIFSALAAALWLGERLTGRTVLGLGLGIAGVALLAGFGPIPINPTVVAAAAACLVAAALYGWAAVYTRRRLAAVPSQATATYTQVFAALVLAPFAAVTLPDRLPPRPVIAAVVVLGLLCTGVAFLLYFHLIRQVGPVQTTTVTYLAPAAGMVLGAVFLGDPLNASTAAGFGLVLASAILINQRAPTARPDPAAAHPVVPGATPTRAAATNPGAGAAPGAGGE
ncbi:MAG TPA: EamA family transporter [Bacillota bacterium]